MNIEYMETALKLAAKGEGAVNSNPFVGAVVVKKGRIVGKGYHKKFGGPHAEVFALEEAGEEANGADIYVTLEPCSHQGKTPPCADKLINAGIKRCIIAMRDPNPLVSGRGIQKLKDAGIEVIEGVLEDESKKLNEVFIKYITTGVPFVFLKTAITLDGKIATSKGDSKWISNEKARNQVQILRNKYMANMVGINTVLKDNPNLTCRIEGGRNPFRIVIDPNLKIPLESNLVMNNRDEMTIVVTHESSRENQKYRELLGHKVKFILMEEKSFKMYDVLKKIGEMKIDSVIVEGGSIVISNLFKEKLIDKGMVFIAPKITGDCSAVSFVSGFETKEMSEAIKLKNVQYEAYDDNIALLFEGAE